MACTFRPSTLLLVGAILTALDAPNGVLAVLPDSSGGDGGSAVFLDKNGLCLTLAEVVPTQRQEVTVAFAGGRRRPARVIARDPQSSAVLLQVTDPPPDITPIPPADSRRLQVLDRVWSAGNATDAIASDGTVPISRGVVSGLYEIPAGEPPVRGRGGHVLASWTGPAIESDAAINDGSQGGALLDDAGRLIGLTSRAQVRERRLPLAVPLARILDGLDLAPARTAPAESGTAWRSAAATAAPSLGLVYLQRLRGPGNPDGVARPARLLDEAAASERERLAAWWDQYWHQQQVFYTDQPVCALSLGDDLLLTAASNLHGGAVSGRLLLPDGGIACEVIGRDLPLDLALLRCERPHGLPAAAFASDPPGLGVEVVLLGRHRGGGAWTATAGSISATTRRRAQSRLALLQTDARANYGSLGGVLVNAGGQIVGMCVLLGPHDERPWLINSGVAMAVEASRIAAALPAMREGRTTEQPPILGLGVILNQRNGRLIIQRITPGTGAEAAGLQAGDELRSVAGAPATSPDAVARVLLRRQPGDRVSVVVVRQGSERTLDVELREFTP